MKVLAFGLSHKTTPMDMRERAAFTRAELPPALRRLKESIGDVVILSTCNRTEFYSVHAGTAEFRAGLSDFLSQKTELGREELAPYIYVHEQEDALRHLFRVASGLESLILGESQILGQVRDAYGAAVTEGGGRGVVGKVFHHALRVGKRARTETRIGENALSIGSAAVETARNTLGDISQSRVMVIGAGEAGKLVAMAMRGRGVGQMVVANRTLSRAQELAQELNGTAAGLEDLEELLEQTDIVVSSTDYPGAILSPDLVKRVMAHRNGHPLLIVDIAVPRDADPAVGKIPGVTLLDLDDLQEVSQANRREREGEAKLVEDIIDDELSRFSEWWVSLSVTPTISQMRNQAEALRTREVRRTLKQMPHLSPQDVAHVEAMSQAIVKKLLHQPIAALKKNPGHVGFAGEFFGLDDGFGSG